MEQPAQPFGTAGAVLKLDVQVPDQLNIAPVMGGVALLGEQGKVTAVSTYRFTSVVAGEGGLEVTMQGETSETITLMFARKAAGYKLQAMPVVIGANGTATVHLKA